MKMLKIFAAVLAAVATLSLTGCVDTIAPGSTGIRVNKIGSDRGVSKENIVSGLVFYFPLTTKIIEYPTFNQRVAWTHDTNEGKGTNEELSFQTKDSVPVTLDVAVNYTLRADKVPEFYTQFRADDIRLFTHGYMRDQARNAVAQVGSEYTFDEVNGPKKEEFFSRVNDYLSKAVANYGVVIPQNGLSAIGALRPPETLKTAIAARAKAIQDSITAENELRTYKANAAKAVAQAEGEAAAMRAKSASITPQFMELKRLEIQEKAISKWNGQVPSTMMGAGGNMMFNIPVK